MIRRRSRGLGAVDRQRADLVQPRRADVDRVRNALFDEDAAQGAAVVRDVFAAVGDGDRLDVLLGDVLGQPAQHRETIRRDPDQVDELSHGARRHQSTGSRTSLTNLCTP